MVSVFFLSPNRPSAVFGGGLAAIGLCWLVFGIIYIVNGAGWEGSTGGKVLWIIAGIVVILLSLGATGLGGFLLFYNSLIRRRENRGERDIKPAPITFFDLERLEGALAIPMLALSAVFLINGIIYRIVAAAVHTPGNITLKRLAQGYRVGSSWMFVIMFALWIGAGICLFINRYYVMNREGDAPREAVKAASPKAGGRTKKGADKTKDKKDGEKKAPPPPPPPED